MNPLENVNTMYDGGKFKDVWLPILGFVIFVIALLALAYVVVNGGLFGGA